MPARGLRSNRDNLTTRQIAQPSTGPQSDASTPTTGQTAAQVTATVNAAIATHSGLADPHTGYVLEGGTLADVTVDPPANGVIAALSFSASPTQGECEALRDQCEILRDSLANAISVIETLRVHA